MALNPQSVHDELLYASAELIINQGRASTALLQREFKIGYNRAERIMEQLCEIGIVGEGDIINPRKILVNHQEFVELRRKMTGEII